MDPDQSLAVAQVVRRASGEGLKASRVEVPTDDEDFDTATSYTITVTVRSYLGQVRAHNFTLRCLSDPPDVVTLLRLNGTDGGRVEGSPARGTRPAYRHHHGRRSPKRSSR